jgi:hypothetical protein
LKVKEELRSRSEEKLQPAQQPATEQAAAPKPGTLQASVTQVQRTLGNQAALQYVGSHADHGPAPDASPDLDLRAEGNAIEIAKPLAPARRRLNKSAAGGAAPPAPGGCKCGGENGGTPCAKCAAQAKQQEAESGGQESLTINQPGDVYEKEADAVAERVMRTPSPGTHNGGAFSGGPLSEGIKGGAQPAVRRKCAQCEEEEEKRKRIHRKEAGDGECVQRKCAACQEEEEKTLRRKENGAEAGAAPRSVHEVLRAPGRSLDASTRAWMEPRFGHDFSNVRVHTGSAAAQSARDVNALAYTVGSDLVFAHGQYSPETDQGRRLLAHELTHVIQQTSAEGPAGNGSPVRTMSRQQGEFSGAPARRLQRQDHVLTAVPAAPAASSCRTGMPVGAAHARPEDHGRWPSGSYSIWGPPYNGQDAATYSYQTIQAWMRWRFGALSPAVASRIQTEATGWNWSWTGTPPAVGCQSGTAFSMDDMQRLVRLADRDPAARQAESRETRAGMPALPAPQPIPDTIVTAPGVPGSAPPPPVPDVHTRVEQALDPTSVYEAGAPGSNQPPFPARMDGPDMEVPRGTGTFNMVLDYEAVTSDPLLQMAYHMSLVNYHWELFDVSAMVRAGMGRGAQEEARRMGESPQAEAAAGGATQRRAQAAVEQLSEETIRSWRELRDPRTAAEGGSAVDVITRSFANELNLYLLPVSAIISAGGQVVSALGDLMGGYSQEKEVTFPNREGFYMVRCIAQPAPRGPQRSEIRAASVRSKIVEVRPIETLARNALDAPEAAIAELQLQRVMTSDAATIARLDRQIAAIRQQSGGDIVAYLTQLIATREAEQAQAPAWQRSRYDRELASLRLRLSQAQRQREGTTGEHYRPRAAFTSVVTGDTYPLMLELTELPVAHGFRVRLTDLTVPDRPPIDRNGSSREQAVRNAFQEMAFHGDLGRGRLVVRMPENWTGAPREFSTPTGDASTAIVRRRLQDLATALLILSVVVPGVGEVSAVIAAGLAVERLISRALAGNLRLDAESVSDTMAILGAVAQGAQLVGRLRIARAGQSFIAAARTGEEGALRTAVAALETARAAGRILDATAMVTNIGGLIWGDLVTLNRLAQLQQDEMDGTVTHSAARRQRAEMLAGAIRDHGVMLAGMLRPHGADRASGSSEATPHPDAPVSDTVGRGQSPERLNETIQEPELERRATEATHGATGDQHTAPPPEGVRARFRTPDLLHDIFILNDGRIFRCSLSCTQLRGWYDPYLRQQPEGSSRHTAATELDAALQALETRAAGGENTPALNEAIGALDVRMREFIAPDLAADLQRGAETRRLVGRGENFLTLEQTRSLLRILNIDEIHALVGEGGARSAAEVRQMADLWGEVINRATPADVVRLRELNQRIRPTAEQLGFIRDYMNARRGLEARAIADLLTATTGEALEAIALRDNIIPPGADAASIARIETMLMNPRIRYNQALRALLREFLEVRRGGLDAALGTIERAADGRQLLSQLRAAAQARTPATAAAPNPRDPVYRHAIDGHGSQVDPQSLMDEAPGRVGAAGQGIPQGQFYNNGTIVDAQNLAPPGPGAVDFDFGRPIGRVFMPDRTVVSDVTRVRVVRDAAGNFIDAYPIPP